MVSVARRLSLQNVGYCDKKSLGRLIDRMNE